MTAYSLYLPLKQKSARHRAHGRQETVNERSVFACHWPQSTLRGRSAVGSLKVGYLSSGGHRLARHDLQLVGHTAASGDFF